ncbi:hypothetical protein EDC94DRAFT_617490 [Helicostylum pulchrum]|nr:hypothetical protein EDC94DRAFT_617490 [Helicostylum pulchrum]
MAYATKNAIYCYRRNLSIVKSTTKKIEDLETFEFCWSVKGNGPFIVSLNRIRSDPLGYKIYPNSNPPSEQSLVKKRKNIELVTKEQVKQFLNEAFCSKKHENSVLYSQQTLATRDVYTVVKMYTLVFNSNTAQSFAT